MVNCCFIYASIHVYSCKFFSAWICEFWKGELEGWRVGIEIGMGIWFLILRLGFKRGRGFGEELNCWGCERRDEMRWDEMIWVDGGKARERIERYGLCTCVCVCSIGIFMQVWEWRINGNARSWGKMLWLVSHDGPSNLDDHTLESQWAILGIRSSRFDPTTIWKYPPRSRDSGNLKLARYR